MSREVIQRILTWCIGMVWLVNGLFCKVLNFVPRHELIVNRILRSDHSPMLTRLIGLAEIVMAIGVWCRFKTRFSAITQIVVVLTMNLLELILAPDLLLFGRVNFIFAMIFCFSIYYNEFFLDKKQS